MKDPDTSPQEITSDPDAGASTSGREWLVTNGLGGYAAGTVRGTATRRYDGLLVAAFPNPRGRWMLLNHVAEVVLLADGTADLDSDRRPGTEPRDDRPPPEFHLEAGLPVWVYDLGAVAVERRVWMAHGRNTTFVRYRLVRGGPVRLSLQPFVHFRSAGDSVAEFEADVPYNVSVHSGAWEIRGDDDHPPLRLRVVGARADFRDAPQVEREVLYSEEAERGYHAAGDLWTPGTIGMDLPAGGEVTLVASSEEWDHVESIRPDDELRVEQARRDGLLAAADPAVRSGPVAELVFAADQFVITPPGEGPDDRSIIAGYYWFKEWGRDTMISLDGLTLVTGRPTDARRLLERYADFMRNGLIPEHFPEGHGRSRYNAADATLWFFVALNRYVEVTGDRDTLRRLLPRLRDAVAWYLRGTDYNIRVDPADGLVTQGVADQPLTWMDAKVGDWVVTPRRGKAVEINALWFNALKHLEGWLRNEGQTGAADEMAEHAAKARASFNDRFWQAAGGYLYDVVDGDHGDDRSLRPNQLFAISLPHPVLAEDKWRPVLDAVRTKLLTPAGLRSLDPDDSAFRPRYDGDRRDRDAAYHQGTVWPWLIGPFIDAWLKVYPDRMAEAREFLSGLIGDVGRGAIGTVSEICDAEPPYTPRGCPAQALSVAEVLRCCVKTSDD